MKLSSVVQLLNVQLTGPCGCVGPLCLQKALDRELTACVNCRTDAAGGCTEALFL